MSQNLEQLIKDLSKNNLTITLLQSLAPMIVGKWDNFIELETAIREITGEENPELIEEIKNHALSLYNDKSQGYQKAMLLYQNIQTIDSTLSEEAIKLSSETAFGKKRDRDKEVEAEGKIPLVDFINQITPKDETTKAIDFAIKVVVELIAFSEINGMLGENIQDFVNSFANYSDESVMSIGCLICIDGLLALDSDFILKVKTTLDNISPENLEKNSTFNRVKALLPGNTSKEQLYLIRNEFHNIQDWMRKFVEQRNFNPQNIVYHLESFLEFPPDNNKKVDLVSEFLGITTNYIEYTGTQILLRSLIDRAQGEI